MREDARLRIDDAVLFLYKNAFQEIRYPIDPQHVIGKLKLCRCMSYEELAAVNGVTVADVIRACNSADGCTHYDPKTNRYLMAINTHGRPAQRIRWTAAHELGHIAANHFIELVNDGKQVANPSDLAYMEEEADYFAASFLAPFPAIRALSAKSAEDIRCLFGLSQTAAEYRWAEFADDNGNTELDLFFRKRIPRSNGERPGIVSGRALDVWADADL